MWVVVYNHFVGRLKAESHSNIGMFWIGGHDESDEGGWVWSDGSPFNFFNFRTGKDRFQHKRIDDPTNNGLNVQKFIFLTKIHTLMIKFIT